MKRITIVVAAALATALFFSLAGVCRAESGARPPAARDPFSLKAEEVFFLSFNRGVVPPAEAIKMLTGAYAADPADGRTTLLLGMAHLWQAAEGSRQDPASLEHLFLAERFLARAERLLPADHRIPSWLAPARLSLAKIERDREAAGAALESLVAAHAKEPNFHSFSVALVAHGSPRGSEPFERGLRALRDASGCSEDFPSCADLPRWPYNREGFATFRAEYELKAGNLEAARHQLEALSARPAYASWPHRADAEALKGRLEESAKLYSDSDPANDPPSLFTGSRQCQMCHRAAAVNAAAPSAAAAVNAAAR